MATPSAPQQLLIKVLKLELGSGCQDRAAMGGISTFANRWLPSVIGSAAQPHAQALKQLYSEFRTYDALTPEQRTSLVGEGLDLLRQLAVNDSSAQAGRRGEDGPHWDDPCTVLTGVGGRRAGLLAKLGIFSVGELLLHCPLSYEDRSQLTPVAELTHRQTHTLRLKVAGDGQIVRRGKLSIVRVPAEDDSGPCTLVWFNQPYRASMYAPGTQLLIRGEARLSKGRATISVREAEALEDSTADWESHLVPLYPLTTGLSQTMFRKLIRQALEHCDALPPGVVPPALEAKRGLPALPWAVAHVHTPVDTDEARAARARLHYERLFVLQARLAQHRHAVKQHNDQAVVPTEGILAELEGALAFTLTGAQRRVIEQVLGDLAQPEPAYRLIHGDVGSGKTVVAVAAVLAAVRAGRQAAVMAPTEILAEQDWAVAAELLNPLGIQPALLTGSLREVEKAAIRTGLASGSIDCVVGTHALVQEGVSFADLAVAVIDEQQRFGVAQRARLATKGTGTNILVMSATPIPRTLALTAYGDFDVSVVDELPPGRQPVHTELLTGRQTTAAYETIIGHAGRGRQAYVVCPVIEPGKTAYLAAAEQLFERLSRHVLPTLRLGLVHGQMPTDQREATMTAFRTGEIDVLVATSVVEVGVDVPNATVMLVQNAERFGLAQLHQLRGRGGRGDDQAYCLLVAGSRSPQVIDRLNVLVKTNDGFEIASEDLRRRGPGELTGARQHGIPDLEMAGLVSDTRILAQAREDAFALITQDPYLQEPAHNALQRYLALHAEQNDEWTI